MMREGKSLRRRWNQIRHLRKLGAFAHVLHTLLCGQQLIQERPVAAGKLIVVDEAGGGRAGAA